MGSWGVFIPFDSLGSPFAIGSTVTLCNRDLRLEGSFARFSSNHRISVVFESSSRFWFGELKLNQAVFLAFLRAIPCSIAAYSISPLTTPFFLIPCPRTMAFPLRTQK